MPVHILGIRHHGPGSARNVRQKLESLRPDLILIEGPPEGDTLIAWCGHPDMQPPVALLAYRPDAPEQALFYPFAEFSPEWQAMTYAVRNNIPVRFMDLPLQHHFALTPPTSLPEAPDPQLETTESPVSEPEETPLLVHPMQALALQAGFEDEDLWWETMFERRRESEDSFPAIREAMAAAREAAPEPSRREQLREAWMRKTIRQFERGFPEIAVICGAWHAPALEARKETRQADDALLHKLEKVKVEATWIPWTYSRLSWMSGYGAGVFSPGWYHHHFEHPADEGERWMSLVAGVLRRNDIDVSPAHVIEAVRLARTLAALRNLPRPGIAEMREAVISVICMGEEMPYRLIASELVVSERMGTVPADAPRVPLQLDIERQVKSLKIKTTAEAKTLELDLRQPLDLQRSIFLHRLALLDIHWGKPEYTSGKGTFKEAWTLQWQPEMQVRIIECGIWGNTLSEATTQFVNHQLSTAEALSGLVDLLRKALPADLPAVIAPLILRTDQLAAGTSDVLDLMRAWTPLARLTRYGDVRETDLSQLAPVTEAIALRISIGLPVSASALDEDNARRMATHIQEMRSGVALLETESITTTWTQAMRALMQTPNTPPLLAGLGCRALLDARAETEPVLMDAFWQALSRSVAPDAAAQWLEGFLTGSGMVLLHHPFLWELLNAWLRELEEEAFVQVLPVLRRAFSAFPAGERRQIGDKAAQGPASAAVAAHTGPEPDPERGMAALPVIFSLFGLQFPAHGNP